MRNCFRRGLLLLSLSLLVGVRTVDAQVLDDSLRSDIKKLLDVTNSVQMASQVASLISGQVLSGIKKSQPELPDRAFEIVREVLDSEFAKAFAGPDNLTDQMVSVYAKHFSQEDIRGLVAFYSSALGKKTIALMPVILQESAAVGQVWAEKQMPAIMASLQSRLRAEGFVK